jgi:outer membrane lipoprotein-sorting protein
MQKRMVWMILFFLMWASIPQSFAESNPSLPTTDLEAIIAGLAHTESVLKSGKGKFKMYMASYFRRSQRDQKTIVKKKEQIPRRTTSSVTELEFAFGKTHTYFNRKDVAKFVADGNIQLVIAPHGGISMYPRVAYPPEGLDPRDWGLWYRRQRLSDYLRQQKNARLIGNEQVDGILCYVIQMSEKSTEAAIVKFWITPENGFRLVQILSQTQTRKSVIKFEWRAHQLDGKQKVWFPKRAASISTSDEEDEPVRNEIEITDFKPNTDVSELFDLQIPPETEISNPQFNRPVTFKEIGWKKFEGSRENEKQTR